MLSPVGIGLAGKGKVGACDVYGDGRQRGVVGDLCRKGQKDRIVSARSAIFEPVGHVDALPNAKPGFATRTVNDGVHPNLPDVLGRQTPAGIQHLDVIASVAGGLPVAPDGVSDNAGIRIGQFTSQDVEEPLRGFPERAFPGPLPQLKERTDSIGGQEALRPHQGAVARDLGEGAAHRPITCQPKRQRVGATDSARLTARVGLRQIQVSLVLRDAVRQQTQVHAAEMIWDVAPLVTVLPHLLRAKPEGPEQTRAVVKPRGDFGH